MVSHAQVRELYSKVQCEKDKTKTAFKKLTTARFCHETLHFQTSDARYVHKIKYPYKKLDYSVGDRHDTSQCQSLAFSSSALIELREPVAGLRLEVSG
ncbi:hypothetical protein PoB_002707300 [Plakobranchus ocellatus]|uniref:Uncharacterized protein n=1 Tax=Plakobranchus ocellatus TaxID=259542 RepID=A0AAV4A1S5_9GAST|nr:hypothetical protein PoB_002707300 [Plakobranchus ocellatus]